MPAYKHKYTDDLQTASSLCRRALIFLLSILLVLSKLWESGRTLLPISCLLAILAVAAGIAFYWKTIEHRDRFHALAFAWRGIFLGWIFALSCGSTGAQQVIQGQV